MVNSLNSCLIEGQIVADPLFRTFDDGSDKGKTVCQFTIDSTRLVKKQSGIEKETSYFDVEAWGNLGESCRDQWRKDREVRVVGRIKQNHWTDNEGRELSKVIIVAEHVEFRPLAKKQDEEQKNEVI